MDLLDQKLISTRSPWKDCSSCFAATLAGGMVEFRRSLAASFLFRFFVDVALQLQAEAPGSAAVDWVTPAHASAAQRFHRPASMGMQYYGKAGETDVVGQPERHRAADLQARPCLPFTCSAEGALM